MGFSTFPLHSMRQWECIDTKWMSIPIPKSVIKQFPGVQFTLTSSKPNYKQQLNYSMVNLVEKPKTIQTVKKHWHPVWQESFQSKINPKRKRKAYFTIQIKEIKWIIWTFLFSSELTLGAKVWSFDFFFFNLPQNILKNTWKHNSITWSRLIYDFS